MCEIAGNEPLTWPDVTSSGAIAQGNLLPRSLAESLSVLDDDPAGLEDVLGDCIVPRHANLKCYELSQFERVGFEQARNLLIHMFSGP